MEANHHGGTMPLPLDTPIPMSRAERTKLALDAQIAILRSITDVVHRDGGVGPEQDPRKVLADLEQIRDLLYP
jgi:hypothetical protein